MASIKKNFVYSSILTTANYVFPFLTFPYVSRVLGVTNIGTCNFVDSIINYFILFSMMGIGIVGIREVAKNKNDREALDKAFSGLSVLNTITTLVLLVVLIVGIYTVPKLHEHSELMWLGALKLVFNVLQFEWLYKGLENFKYITTRTILVKMVYVVCVFLFVHKQEDYVIYYLLLTLMTVVNAVINSWYARKFVGFSFHGIDVKTYIKPFFILGVYMVLTSMYTSFNVAFLGFSSGETEVGYYTTATKLYTVLLSVFTAFTGVMLPRMSSLISEGKYDEFKNLLSRSFNALVTFAMPLVFFGIIMAPQIILLIAGDGYEGAIMPMRIVMPLMLVIGYEQILVIQTLMPLKEDKLILRNSLYGACAGLLLNFAIVPYLNSIGSSIVWFVSELVVLCGAQYATKKILGLCFPWKTILKNAFYYIPMAAIVAIISIFVNQPILSLALSGIIMTSYCYVLNIRIIKNEEVIKAVDAIKNKFKHTNK